MSSILSLGALALQQPIPSGGPTDTQPPPADSDGSQTVQPSGGTNTSNGADTSGAETNSGRGSTKQEAGSEQNTQQTQPTSQPPLSRATSSSVVQAQSTPAPEPREISEEFARQSAINLMEKRRDDTLFDRLKQPAEVAELTIPKKAPDLPDPLPTSPFLKSNDDAE